MYLACFYFIEDELFQHFLKDILSLPGTWVTKRLRRVKRCEISGESSPKSPTPTDLDVPERDPDQDHQDGDHKLRPLEEELDRDQFLGPFDQGLKMFHRTKLALS